MARVVQAAGRESMFRWPDRIVPRWKKNRRTKPPATSTLPLGSNVAV